MSTPAGPLRAYDDDLGGVLSLLISDLAGSGAMGDIEANRMVWECAQGYLDWQSGPVAGGQVVVWVTEALQDDLIERRSDHVWPQCPDHPNHPLWLDSQDSADPWWTCHTAQRAVARLGELDGIRRT